LVLGFLVWSLAVDCWMLAGPQGEVHAGSSGLDPLESEADDVLRTIRFAQDYGLVDIDNAYDFWRSGSSVDTCASAQVES